MIAVDKIVEIKTDKKSFIYFDETSDGVFRVCYTSSNADIVRKLRDEDVIIKEEVSDEN